MLVKGDLITLENDQEYVVAEAIEYQNQDYLMLFPSIKDELIENAKFVKIIEDKDKNQHLVNIDNEKELYEVLDILIPLFEQDYIEDAS